LSAGGESHVNAVGLEMRLTPILILPLPVRGR
jgi:hypothetical protein